MSEKQMQFDAMRVDGGRTSNGPRATPDQKKATILALFRGGVVFWRKVGLEAACAWLGFAYDATTGTVGNYTGEKARIRFPNGQTFTAAPLCPMCNNQNGRPRANSAHGRPELLAQTSIFLLGGSKPETAKAYSFISAGSAESCLWVWAVGAGSKLIANLRDLHVAYSKANTKKA